MKNSLRYFRKQKGWSQVALAKRIVTPAQPDGYSDKTISLYEGMERPLPVEFLESAAEVLGISKDDLAAPPPNSLEDEPPESPDNVLPLEALTESQLEGLFKSISSEIPEAVGPRKKMLLQSVSRIADELKKRMP